MSDVTSSSSSDRAGHARLIERIAQDADSAAFAELFGYFAPRLKGFLMRGGASAELADDVTQDAMLAVWRKADQFDASRAGAATWIYTIARNLRIDAARRGVLQTVPDDFMTEERSSQQIDAASVQSAETVAAGQEREDKVRQAIQRLPQDQAKVVMLAFFHGGAHADLAQELALPLGTVKSRLRLAMGKLRVLLGELAE